MAAAASLRNMSAHRLDSIALQEARVANSRIYTPEQERIAAVAELSQRGSRPAASLDCDEAIGRGFRGGTIHRRSQEIGNDQGRPLGLGGKIRSEIDQRAASGSRQLGSSFGQGGFQRSRTALADYGRWNSSVSQPNLSHGTKWRGGDDAVSTDRHGHIVTAAAAAQAGHLLDLPVVGHAARLLSVCI